ncbi:hypothetical protein [Synoicihabitans lomoniglobus]|uniref:Uncharacterized protein n=1 Tax=Synoicihabitans lomoniglobus TaxID=2909285 RepID=A0AAE9ZXQ7_9BACT|nr:DUF3106 domain-containing protein [Opitutaceae bacterium LMO-M01]WED64870.1 hypothetical protein PXH66_21195 [Opitutaceae bacterium LMO-M01]
MISASCRKYLFLIPVAIVVFLGVFTWAVQALWNGVLVDVVAVSPITYWQALGLLVLCKILFGGWPGGRCRHHDCGPRARREKLAQDWSSMDPAKRDQLRAKMKRWCGDWSDDEPTEPDGPAKSVKPNS